MPASNKTSPALHYRIDIADVHAHLYGVTLTIAQPAAQQRVSIPVWIVGSYMVLDGHTRLARQAKRARFTNQ